MFKLIKKSNGQSLIEYLILVALVAIGSIAVVRVVGQNIAKQYENINHALGAKNTERLSLSGAGKSAYSKKDLSSFLNGAVTDESKKQNSGQNNNGDNVEDAQ